jgi:hypothetical protein
MNAFLQAQEKQRADYILIFQAHGIHHELTLH